MTQQPMEYTGSIDHLQGMIAQVRSPSSEEQKGFIAPLPEGIVMAQFSWIWCPFPLKDFTPITGKPVF